MVNNQSVNKWDIWYCSLDPTEGSEQHGKRPVLVISNDAVNTHLNICCVLPITSVKADTVVHRTEVFLPMNISGLHKDSLVLSHQIRTVSHARLISRLSKLTDEEYRKKILSVCRELIEY